MDQTGVENKIISLIAISFTLMIFILTHNVERNDESDFLLSALPFFSYKSAFYKSCGPQPRRERPEILLKNHNNLLNNTHNRTMANGSPALGISRASTFT